MKPSVLLALLLITGIHIPLAQGTKLYKWVDEQGNVTYQDRPPPANASEVEEKHINPNEGVTKFVVPKPAEPGSDDKRLGDSGPQAPSSGSGGLSAAEKGAIATSDRPLRSERRRGVVPTPPPRPAPAVPPRVGRRPGGGGTPRPMPHR